LYNFNIRASVLIWDYILLSPAYSFDADDESLLQLDGKFGLGFTNTITFAMKII
jgi:hypothetical protein